jgi:hypothetical protein
MLQINIKQIDPTAVEVSSKIIELDWIDYKEKLDTYEPTAKYRCAIEIGNHNYYLFADGTIIECVPFK